MVSVLCFRTPSLLFQTVGDAMSDMLVVEAVLCCQKLSISDWSNFYTELPNRQLKVKVTFFHISTSPYETHSQAYKFLQSVISV